jgi:SHS2 domain-containing protein
MFELLEHPADIGFRARGASQAELFEAAAEALLWVALEVEAVEARETYALQAQGDDPESLLVNWLSEVLYLWDARRLALRRCRVLEIAPGRVVGEGLGEPWDPARHRAKLVIKGVTYHQLRVGQDRQGWCAQVFLDI